MTAQLVDSSQVVTRVGTSVRFHNLDLMRFMAAVTVVASHISMFFPHDFDSRVFITRAHYFAHSISAVAFNGVAAVMLFFVISGICIHAPYRGGAPINILEFYVRRFVRVGIPLLVAIGITRGLTALGYHAADSVIWSLWCEIIYYLLYPLLLVLIDKVGFVALFAVSVIGALLFSLVPDQLNDHAWDYGPFLTWIVFLPVWLAGIWIAEHSALVQRLPGFVRTNGFGAIAAFVLIALSNLAIIAQFHVDGGIQYPLYLMLAFSCYASGFIFVIISLNTSQYRFARVLEREGRWSYSLYLIHFPVLYTFSHLLHSFDADRITPNEVVLLSPIAFLSTILAAFIFYIVVEKPSHWLAKHWGKQVSKLRLPATLIRPA
jgi:peptidoglycan/LPS O-acetylase OafA/YrhL